MNKKPNKKEVEKQLIPKLKMMGYILLVFASICLGYRFTLSEPQEPQFELFDNEESVAGFSFLDDDEEALLPTNPKSYYFFATMFSSVGLLCIAIARNKLRKLSREEESN